MARSLPQVPVNFPSDLTGVPVHGADHPAPSVSRVGLVAVLQRCGGTSCPPGTCDHDDEPALQRQAASPAMGAVPAALHDVVRLPGEPLPSAVRQFMELGFRHDFSHVRVHTDAAAARTAESVRARAYTVGRDVVFGAGQFMPDTAAGQRLIAHELAHVIQQGGTSDVRQETGRLAAQPLTVSNPSDPAELEADRAACTVLAQPASGAVVGVSAQTRQQVSRAGQHCGGTWTCASGPACEQPDSAGDGKASSSWQLDLNIDTDVESSTDIRSAADVGHTYVVFSESNGAQYSYGFYPRPETKPTDFRSSVFGCFVHPDVTHKTCVDYTKSYKLSQSQYSSALQFAQLLCKAPPRYDLFNWNCTTASVEIAKRAGQTPPPARGPVAARAAQADNPNTLKEGYLDQELPTRRLTSDTDIRNWVSSKPSPDITAVPTTEKVRMLLRLLQGWVSDEDVSAFEKICSSIITPAERKAVQDQVGPHEKDLHFSAQQARVHAALFAQSPAPASGVTAPSPLPPPPPPR
jgi:hypothetical protein